MQPQWCLGVAHFKDGKAEPRGFHAFSGEILPTPACHAMLVSPQPVSCRIGPSQPMSLKTRTRLAFEAGSS